MENNKKNIAALIIISSIICIIIALFLPKNNVTSQVNKQASIKNSCFSFNPLSARGPLRDEHISVIRIDGIISDSPGNSIFRELTTSSAALELIQKAIKDDSIKALVIRVNSPGGTVAASQELYKAIAKARKEKPVVITMGDIAASGGYYIAAAADSIFANPGTLTGSIGVITSYINVHQLFTMYGLEGVTIKAGKYKDIGSPTRPMNDEERKLLQDLLNDSYNQFITDVSKGRGMPKDKVSKLAEGLIYTGQQAKKVGLVDFIGDYYKAIKHAQVLAKKRFPELARRYKDKDLPVDESWKSTSIIDILVGAISHVNQSKIIENKFIRTYSYSRFQPLWLLE